MADATVTREALHLGTEATPMFSLRHLQTGLWLTLDADGALRLGSPEPIYLGTFYDAPDAGSEAFAWQFLAWLRATVALEDAATEGCAVDIHPVDLEYAVVCRFIGERPLLVSAKPTALSAA